MYKFLAGLIGLGGIVAAAPAAQASVNAQAALDHAQSVGTIEALEDLAWRYPALKAAVAVAEAKFECAQGQQWKCGADGRSEPRHRGYGG